MAASRQDTRFDELAGQVDDWVESAVTLDEGRFPSEVFNDFRDLVQELRDYLEHDAPDRRDDVMELFVSAEMAEVIERFPKVRRVLENAWGSQLTEMINEESGYVPEDDDEDEEDDY